MTANTKSLVLLALTLIVGFSLGLFADATLVRGRRDRLGELRRPPGFVAHMNDIIDPHSPAQRDSIRPIVEAAAERNQQIIRAANDHLRASMDSMRTSLAPLLDAEQRARLEREAGRQPNPFGPGGARGGPPPGGPPPNAPPAGGGPPPP
ncbi:MAG TPA: hypothetical protein VHB25_17340 [Gemmatimonadaceae bacterium]|nr:hypothetical protein [Gemmatimonadaceae bacterium]